MIIEPERCNKCLYPYPKVVKGMRKLVKGWRQFIFTTHMGSELGPHKAGILCPSCFQDITLWLNS